jgi:hypothetical protein
VDATEAEKANAVQVVDPTEVNELDRAAAAVPTESSWKSFLEKFKIDIEELKRHETLWDSQGWRPGNCTAA